METMKRLTNLVKSAIPDITWTLQLKIQFFMTLVSLGISIYGLKFYPDPELKKYFFMILCGVVGYWLPGGGDTFNKDKLHWTQRLTIQLIVSAIGILVVLVGLRTVDKEAYTYLFGLLGGIIFFWLPRKKIKEDKE